MGLHAQDDRHDALQRFGQAQVSTIYQALTSTRGDGGRASILADADALNGVYVLSRPRQVPLNAIARYEASTAPLAVNHRAVRSLHDLFQSSSGVTLARRRRDRRRDGAHRRADTSRSFQGNGARVQARSTASPG